MEPRQRILNTYDNINDQVSKIQSTDNKLLCMEGQ